MVFVNNLNNLNILHRELRIVAEFVVSDSGALKIPSKLKTQLNQIGIYELDLWEKFLEQYLSSLEDLFVIHDNDELDSVKTHVSDEEQIFYDEDALQFEDEDVDFVAPSVEYKILKNNVYYLVNEEISPSYQQELLVLTDINDQNSLIKTDEQFDTIDDDLSEEELDDSTDLHQEFTLFVTIVIFFFKRKGKTIVYFTNPFVSPDLTQLIWLNTFDFYCLIENIFERNKFFPYYKKNNYNLNNIWNFNNWIFFSNLKNFWVNKLKIRTNFYNFFNFKFRQLSNKFLISWYKRRLFLKYLLKSRKNKRFYHFLYLLKSKRWISFDALFKLIIWKSIFLKYYFNFIDLKTYLYSLFSLTVFYRGFLKKKYKKRHRFKDSVKRNIYGTVI